MIKDKSSKHFPLHTLTLILNTDLLNQSTEKKVPNLFANPLTMNDHCVLFQLIRNGWNNFGKHINHS